MPNRAASEKDLDNAIKDSDEVIRHYYGDKKKENFDKTIKDYNKAIELRPDSALVYCHRGETWLHKQDWDKAREDLADAKKLGVNIIASLRRDSENGIEEFEGKKLYSRYAERPPQNANTPGEPFRSPIGCYICYFLLQCSRNRGLCLTDL